ncbi:MAG: serine/threonine-protein kinase, partial [Opitutales bacterium]
MPTLLPREERLFEQARLLPTASEREAFLTRACGADESLRAHLRSLLALHTQAESFFSEGASLLGHSPTVSEWRRHSLEVGKRGGGERQVGERIGRYKLIEPIGEGGCGIVYLAQQEEPVRRHVALKIIRVGMETSSVIQRFEAERQAIAMMDHPNIARIFDAGETDCGLPFFVMEYVRGVRLTDYCEEHRLSLRTRLELFIQVCHAIQHAHQNCIVHGDIKPSNILIAQHDGVALPKVIDFGISKATESRRPEKHPHVTVAQLVGTPAYMSPEQVEMGGLEIDTRSDIYSLGVLLYELLTSYTPLDGRALANASHEEVQRIFREHHPVPPSCLLQRLTPEVREHLATTRRLSPPRLGRLLQGDLDSIAMKALETDRRRRYETADAFAMDVRRHLANEPVMARPSSWVYRTGKLFRRNRGTFFATAMVMTALILGTSLSTWMFLREREARQRAVAAEQQQSRLRFEAETRES